MVHAAQVGFVGGRVHLPGRGHSILFSGRNLHRDLLGDGTGNLRLELEHTRDLALERVGPQVAVGGRIDQLRGDPYLIGLPVDRSRNDRVDAELQSNLRQRQIAALEAKERGPRNHSPGSD